jgi:hypothetical protein
MRRNAKRQKHGTDSRASHHTSYLVLAVLSVTRSTRGTRRCMTNNAVTYANPQMTKIGV